MIQNYHHTTKDYQKTRSLVLVFTLLAGIITVFGFATWWLFKTFVGLIDKYLY